MYNIDIALPFNVVYAVSPDNKYFVAQEGMGRISFFKKSTDGESFSNITRNLIEPELLNIIENGNETNEQEKEEVEEKNSYYKDYSSEVKKIEVIDVKHTLLISNYGFAVYDTTNGNLKCVHIFEEYTDKSPIIYSVNNNKDTIAFAIGPNIQLYELDRCIPLTDMYQITLDNNSKKVVKIDMVHFQNDDSVIVGYNNNYIRRKPMNKNKPESIENEIKLLTGRNIDGETIPLSNIIK